VNACGRPCGKETSPLLGAAFESGLLPPQSILGMATVPALPGP